jgi:hypothetical protein
MNKRFKGSEIFFDHSAHTWRVPAIAGAVRKAMKENGLLSHSEHSVTRLKLLNLTDSQQRERSTIHLRTRMFSPKPGQRINRPHPCGTSSHGKCEA